MFHFRRRLLLLFFRHPESGIVLHPLHAQQFRFIGIHGRFSWIDFVELIRRADFIAPSSRSGLIRTEMVILDVDSQRLLNVRREIAQGTLVHPSAHVILQMSVQIPLVGRPEFA